MNGNLSGGNKSNLDLQAYMQKVATIVSETPSLAPIAYAKAAAYVRELAEKPENTSQKILLKTIASRLDLLSMQSCIPQDDQVDQIGGEEGSPYADSQEVTTEFEGLIADTEASKIGPNGYVNDELEQAARLSNIQRDRAVGSVKAVQIVPDSAGNPSNQFSDTVLVRFGGTAGSGSFISTTGVSGAVVAKQEAPIIRWDGNDREAVPCTICISPVEGGVNADYPNSGGALLSYSYRPFAHVFWGSGERGKANEAYVDVGRGVRFTLAASHVYVNVGMDNFLSTYTAGAMYLTGNLAFFAGQTQAPVTRTRYSTLLSNATGETHVVPHFAKRLLPPQCTATTGTTRLDFQDANGTTLYSLLYANGNIVTPIPIANDVYQTRINNIDSGADNSYRLVYELSL